MPKWKAKKPDPPMLPDGCGYMGYEFGAGYIDSQCFGGRLYDLDNCDGDMLYEPGDYLPCPKCQMEEWFEKHAEDVAGSLYDNCGSSLPNWKMICRFALKTNRDEALRLLTGRFKTVPYLTERRGRLTRRVWTFDESKLKK